MTPQSTSKTVLVFGSNGQIGTGFRKAFANNPNYTAHFFDSSTVNYQNANEVAAVFKETNPDIVINCVAYTDVDGANLEENKELCQYLNIKFPYMLASLCLKSEAEFVHFSTDYVYNGTPIDTSFKENSICDPRNYYGVTKHKGDKLVRCFNNVKIFRVQCVYSNHKKNFYKTINQLCASKDSINVVSDQITSPTPAYWIADMVVETLQTPQYGIYNLVPEGNCSFADFAEKISDGRCVINRITTDQYPSKTIRPKNSRLDNTKFKVDFGYEKLPSWEEVFRKYKNANFHTVY